MPDDEPLPLDDAMLEPVEEAPSPPPKPADDEDDLGALDLVDEPADDGEPHETKIRAFGEGKVRAQTVWKRQPNADGTGATHVKTFYAKLRADAVEYLDTQINEWLDDHPEVEVKFVTTTIGELVGKISEPALFVNVWV